MKKKLVILGAAAMVAAVAVPALAFENEFHGMYRMRGMMTNFQNAGISPLLTVDSTRDTTLFEQRARLMYIAKASDDLKLVTHFEIDSTWGDSGMGKATNGANGTLPAGNDTNGRGTGAGIGGDTVNIETKSVYLDFKVPSTPVNMKVGLMPFSDAYKGVFLNDDIGGAVASAKFDALTLTGAFFRPQDATTGTGTGIGTASPLGKQNVDIYVLDGKFALNKDTTLGASYYLVNNDENASNQKNHTIGINASSKIGIVGLDGFFLYQTGDEIYKTSAGGNVNNKSVEAFAFQLAPKVNFGSVTLRLASLYTSGDKQNNPNATKSFQNINGYVGQSNNYYSSQMLILMRSVWAMDSDQALVTSTNNGGSGLFANFLGADVKVNDKFNVSANIGTASVVERNHTVAAKSSTTSKEIGTELNLSANYLLYPSLTATLQGAVAFLGGYTKAGAGDFNNPYLTGVMLNYTF